MSHAQDDFLDALFAGLFDREVQQRNQTFRAFERKTFCADEFLADELLERDGVGQPRENAELFVARELNAVLASPPCGAAASGGR